MWCSCSGAYDSHLQTSLFADASPRDLPALQQQQQSEQPQQQQPLTAREAASVLDFALSETPVDARLAEVRRLQLAAAAIVSGAGAGGAGAAASGSQSARYR